MLDTKHQKVFLHETKIITRQKFTIYFKEFTHKKFTLENNRLNFLRPSNFNLCDEFS